MPSNPGHENWYVLDDAKLIGEFLNTEWKVSPRVLKKPEFKYTQDTDNDTFNYSTGEILCSITSDSERNDPKGMGFDGYNYERTILIRMRCMSKDKIITAQDEVDRILARHGVRPSADWHVLYKRGSSPIYPFRKFFQIDIEYCLKSFWKPRYHIAQ